MGILQDAVGIANSVTQDLGLQTTVTHEAFVSQAGDGTVTFAAAVTRPALVVKKQRMVRTSSGEMTQSQASVTFLDPSVSVDTKDRITLPDGTTGPILNTEGYIDSSNQPILTE